MSEINEWTRYWCPIDETYYIDRNGYLIDPSYGQFSANSHLIENPFRRSEKCIILLGEPGIGKTTTMEKFHHNFELNLGNNNAEICLIKLEHIGNENRFISEVFENSVFQRWLESDFNLYLLLDSFDECVLRVDVVSQLLINQLQKYPLDRLYIRIACRTGYWSDILQQQLITLFGEDNFKVYKLTHLRKKDIEIRANSEIQQENGKTTSDFIDKIEILEAVPFAIHPVTLKFLINLYNKGGTLPETKTEIYRTGCFTLCEEIAGSRRETSLIGNYTPEQRYIIAARCAAYCAFSRKSGIWTNINLGDIPDDFISESEIRGGYETAVGQEFDITRESVSETISCGLFNSSRPRREWAHRTYMEFMAADYLIKRNIPLIQIQSLIKNPLDPNNRVAPHLRGIVAWICSNNQELYNEILIQEPEILLQSDIGLFTEEKKAEIIGIILEKYDESPLKPRYYEFAHFLKKFKHNRIETQISEFISETTNSYDSKRFAIIIAEECKLISLSSQFIDIVLNENEHIHLRIAAARALENLSYFNQIEGRERLIPIALSDESLDDQFDLKGVCLHIVWPDLIEFNNLIEHLPEPNIGYVGAHYRFLLGKFIEELPQRDIIHALRWIRETAILSTSSSLLRRVVEKIILKSLGFMDNDEVLESITETLSNLIIDDYYLNESSFDSEVRSTLENNTEMRRILLKKVLQFLPNDNILLNKLSMNIITYIHSQPRLFELIDESDFNWMLQELENSQEEEYQEKLVYLLIRMLRNRSDMYEKAYELYLNNDILHPYLISWFGPIELESELAENMQRDYEREQQLQERLIELRQDNQRPLIEPLPEERIRILLENFEEGNINSWILLNREMTLRENSREYGNFFNPNLKSLPGWIDSTGEIRVRIINAARVYIIEGDPDTQTWLYSNSYSRAALAGYRAIRLLYEIDIEFIKNLSSEAWKKWTPIILLNPINVSENEQEEQIRKNLLEMVYPHAKEEFFLALNAEIDKNNQNHGRIYILDKIKYFWDEDLGNFLHNKALEEHLEVESKGQTFDFLLKHNFSITIDFILRLLRNPISEEVNAREFTIRCAQGLILYCKEGNWDVIWPLIQNNEEWGKETLEQVAKNARFSKEIFDKYSEKQLADLYIWLIEHYTPETDTPLTSGARFINLDDTIREWRDSILRYLVSKGKFEAVDAIRYISDMLPERSENLSFSLIRAIENARNFSWEPPNPKELRILFENPASRLVQSGRQLLELINESLSRLEDKIQGRGPYSPIARFLWDHVGNREFRPVFEDDFSDYIKNHLYDDLSQDIVIHREVEISPLTRTDILITIFNSGARIPQNREISVVVEVKGKWNQYLMTAMENQLLNDYMIPRSFQYGMYLVGWFESQYWNESDWRYNMHRRITSIEDLRDALEEQAQELSERGFIIRPKVIDISLNEIHERMYRRLNEND